MRAVKKQRKTRLNGLEQKIHINPSDDNKNHVYDLAIRKQYTTKYIQTIARLVNDEPGHCLSLFHLIWLLSIQEIGLSSICSASPSSNHPPNTWDLPSTFYDCSFIWMVVVIKWIWTKNERSGRCTIHNKSLHLLLTLLQKTLLETWWYHIGKAIIMWWRKKNSTRDEEQEKMMLVMMMDWVENLLMEAKLNTEPRCAVILLSNVYQPIIISLFAIFFSSPLVHSLLSSFMRKVEDEVWCVRCGRYRWRKNLAHVSELQELIRRLHYYFLPFLLVLTTWLSIKKRKGKTKCVKKPDAVKWIW